MALYKNWPEICRIGRLDKLLMLVLASISTDENDEIAMRLWLGFPECFSETEIVGPFPLSVIRHRADSNGRFVGVSDGANYPGSYDALDNIPYLCFEVVTDEREPSGNLEDIWFTWETVALLKQGDAFQWKDKSMVVLEVSKSWFYIAPAECIALDL